MMMLTHTLWQELYNDLCDEELALLLQNDIPGKPSPGDGDVVEGTPTPTSAAPLPDHVEENNHVEENDHAEENDHVEGKDDSGEVAKNREGRKKKEGRVQALHPLAWGIWMRSRSAW